MIEYILEVNMPNANNLLVRCENWGLGVFTAGDRGLSVLLCFFLPLQTLIQTVFPRSATAALTCVPSSFLLYFSPDNKANKTLLMPCCVKVALPAHDVGEAQDEAQWQTGCPDGAGSLSLLPLLRGQKASQKKLLRSVFYCFTRTLWKWVTRFIKLDSSSRDSPGLIAVYND